MQSDLKKILALAGNKHSQPENKNNLNFQNISRYSRIQQCLHFPNKNFRNNLPSQLPFCLKVNYYFSYLSAIMSRLQVMFVLFGSMF